MRLVLAALALAACSFDSSGLGGTVDAAIPDSSVGDASSVDAVDGNGSIVVHIPMGREAPGTADVTLSSLSTPINTSTPTIDGIGMLPGAPFDTSPQTPMGPELAVLRVRTFTIPAGGQVRAYGTRPLVIIASGDVDIEGSFEVLSAAAPPGMGEGKGETGFHSGMRSNSGGGGAGFGTDGAPGGDSLGEGIPASGGLRGSAYGDDLLTVLQGGSGGGPGGGPACPAAAGGIGGGALQIYSQTRIHIGPTGGINAGGKGGGGGTGCTGQAGAGAGGGSGGAIFLQAPTIDLIGVLAANGGGGGGGGASPMTDGQPGEDGHLSAQSALGGVAGGAGGQAGGAGGAQTSAPGAGTADNTSGGGNAGGGGGAVGHIRILTHSAFNNQGVTSPPAVIGSY